MKCMIVAALAIVAVVQGKPYEGVGVEGELGPIEAGAELGGGIGSDLGLDGGLGDVEGGEGLGGVRGEYGSGADYGDTGFANGNSDYGNTGYDGGAVNVHHDVGHQESDFDQETHRHQSSSHDIGGASMVHGEGHNIHGHNGFATGHSRHGHRYNHGSYVA